MPKVLVVDDELGIRELLRGMLYEAGYDVIEAATGDAALECAHRERPDVVLMDLIMPVMDGFEALAHLKENPATRNIPVIMLTGIPADKGEPYGIKFGVSHYVTKPWGRGTVELAVRSALRNAQAPSDGDVVKIGELYGNYILL